MQATGAERAQARQTVVVCCALLAVELLLDVPTLIHWTQGAPPAYPHQYESRLLSSLTLISIMGALLVTRSRRYYTSSGRVLCWLLLAVAAVALAVQVIKY